MYSFSSPVKAQSFSIRFFFSSNIYLFKIRFKNAKNKIIHTEWSAGRHEIRISIKKFFFFFLTTQ